MFEKAKLPALTCLCLLSAALQVASEMVAAQKQRILEGRPAATGAAATAAPSAVAAVPTPPTETMLPEPGEEAAEAAEPAAAAEGLAAEHEALRAAAAELAAAEEAAVERPVAAAAVVGEELGVAAVEEAGEAKVRLWRGIGEKRCGQIACAVPNTIISNWCHQGCTALALIGSCCRHSLAPP